MYQLHNKTFPTKTFKQFSPTGTGQKNRAVTTIHQASSVEPAGADYPWVPAPRRTIPMRELDHTGRGRKLIRPVLKEDRKPMRSYIPKIMSNAAT